MRWLVVVVVVIAACGDSVPATPDASVDAAPAAPVPGCVVQPTSDLGPVAPGTLAGWDPEGRWFYTGAPVGEVSSVRLAWRGDRVVVDGNVQMLATIDADALRYEGMGYVLRISDRQPDGTLWAKRAHCDGQVCQVCTARLERAAYNAGEGLSQGLTLLGELRGADWDDGYTFNVRVLGTLAYVIRTDGLKIIDTADPAHPVEVGHWRRSGNGYSNDVKLVDTGAKRYAVIADSPVDVVDVTDPTSPSLAAEIQEDAHTVFVEERDGHRYAYFGNYDGKAPVYDITDPATPVRLVRFDFGASLLHDLMIDHGIAYLNAWERGFVVVDFTTPTAPVVLGDWPETPTRTSHSSWATTAGGRKIALHGEEAYGAHLDIVDVDPASPAFMQSIGTYKTRDHVSIHNVMARGDRAYFTYYQDGVRVLDLADPTAPVLLGYYNTWDPQGPDSTSDFFEGAVGLDLDAARDLIFVADSPRGLLILRDDTDQVTASARPPASVRSPAASPGSPRP
jgi:hypothetical protein